MAYLWTQTSEIQNYLNECGTIKISDDNDDDVSESTAQQFENEAVYEIATFLSMAFESNSESLSDAAKSIYSDTPLGLKAIGAPANTEGEVCPTYIRLLVAKYAMTKIAMMRLGSSLATLPNWVRQSENDIFAQLRRLVINAETASFQHLRVVGSYDMHEILIKMKTRGQAVMETMN